MKVTYRKIKRPNLPKLFDIDSFCGNFGASSLYIKSAVLLGLSILPDDERSSDSVLFYLQNPALLFKAIDVCELWICGIIPEKSEDAGLERILKCFRFAYPFKWQKKLILLSVDCKNELMCYDNCADGFERAAELFKKRFPQDSKLSDIIIQMSAEKAKPEKE